MVDLRFFWDMLIFYKVSYFRGRVFLQESGILIFEERLIGVSEEVDGVFMI